METFSHGTEILPEDLDSTKKIFETKKAKLYLVLVIVALPILFYLGHQQDIQLQKRVEDRQQTLTTETQAQ